MRAALALIASPAAAQDSIDLSGSVIRLQPSLRAGAVAEVILDNRPVNSALDERRFALSLDGLAVEGEFDWDHSGFGDDAVTITPPEGTVCLPTTCVLVIPEGETGTLWLFATDGVGM